MLITVGDSTSRVNLQYISGFNSHFKSQFCEEKLDLKSLLNMILISEPILMRFVEPIVSSIVGSLLDHPQISSVTLEIYMPWCEGGVFEI